MIERVYEDVAMAAYREYHGKAARKVTSITGWQLRLWESVAAAAIDAWRDNHVVHENDGVLRSEHGTDGIEEKAK